MTASEFAQLYDAQVGTVRTVLHRMGAGAQLDDLTQEVFLRAWRARAAFHERSSHRTWLCRIARNVAIDTLRTARFTEGLDALANTASSDAGPQERALVRQTLAALSPDDRLLIVLLSVEECTMNEIGEILDIPAGTVKSRAFTLRRKLHEALEPEGALA